MNFKPTHQIKLEDGETIKVMLVGEEAYMGHQWAEYSIADYRLEQGKLTYKGTPVQAEIRLFEYEDLTEIDILR